MKNILYISSLIILLFSCTKDKNKESCFKGRDKGDGTISFYLDGKLWQNSCEFNNDGSINGTANESMYVGGFDNGQNYTVTGKIWGNNTSTIYISGNITNIGVECELGDGIAIYDGLIDDFVDCKISLYYNNDEYISKRGFGYIERTKTVWDSTLTTEDKWDTQGIFEATLFNVKDSTDFVKITDGFWNN